MVYNETYGSDIPIPRNVRDGGIAAAIAVALELASGRGTFESVCSDSETDTPWRIAGLTDSVVGRTGKRTEKSWGVLAGWKGNSDKWSNRDE